MENKILALSPQVFKILKLKKSKLAFRENIHDLTARTEKKTLNYLDIIMEFILFIFRIAKKCTHLSNELLQILIWFCVS